MKKTIFDLTNKELKKEISELFQTAYYKKVSVLFIGVILVFIFAGSIMTMLFSMMDSNYDFTISFILIFGFSALTIILFLIKMFGMLENYYNSKKNKIII